MSETELSWRLRVLIEGTAFHDWTLPWGEDGARLLTIENRYRLRVGSGTFWLERMNGDIVYAEDLESRRTVGGFGGLHDDALKVLRTMMILDDLARIPADE